MVDIIALVVGVVALWKLFEWVTWEVYLVQRAAGGNRPEVDRIVWSCDYINSAQGEFDYSVALQNSHTGVWVNVGIRSKKLWMITRYLVHSSKGYPARWGYARIECHVLNSNGEPFTRDGVNVVTELLYGYTCITLRRTLWTPVTDSRIHPRHVSCRCVYPL